MPTLAEFTEAIKAANGNMTNVGKTLGVSRITVWAWAKENNDFSDAIKNARKALFDRCLSTAQIVALGIPKMDENGMIVGWEEKPDSQMLKYFMSTLGRDEGFSEKLDLDITGNMNTNNALSPEERRAELEAIKQEILNDK